VIAADLPFQRQSPQHETSPQKAKEGRCRETDRCPYHAPLACGDRAYRAMCLASRLFFSRSLHRLGNRQYDNGDNEKSSDPASISEVQVTTRPVTKTASSIRSPMNAECGSRLPISSADAMRVSDHKMTPSSLAESPPRPSMMSPTTPMLGEGQPDAPDDSALWIRGNMPSLRESPSNVSLTVAQIDAMNGSNHDLRMSRITRRCQEADSGEQRARSREASRASR